MIQIDAIRQTLAQVLQNAVNVEVRLAFPWSAVVNAEDLNLPAFYIVSPDVIIDEAGLETHEAIVRFQIYYVITTFGVVNPTEPLFDVQDKVVTELMTTTAFRQYDAAVTSVTSSGENQFSNWARLLSKPYEAVMFTVELRVFVAQ